MQALQPSSIPVPLLVDRLEPLTEVFERHAPDAQVNWMRSLGMWQLRRLWTLADRAELTLTPGDLTASDRVTVCPGKNHLPMFSWFEKRFAMIDGQVVGYNESGWARAWVGPGHFSVVPGEHKGELILDYRAVPVTTHPSFPPLRSNEGVGGWPAPLRGIVFGGLRDRLRRASAHLLVGRSDVKGLNPQRGAFFALHLPGQGLEPGP